MFVTHTKRVRLIAKRAAKSKQFIPAAGEVTFKKGRISPKPYKSPFKKWSVEMIKAVARATR